MTPHVKLIPTLVLAVACARCAGAPGSDDAGDDVAGATGADTADDSDADLPGDGVGDVADLAPDLDGGPDVPLDAGADDEVDEGEDALGADAPELDPLAVPFEPAPHSAPAVDAPYLQEVNHTTPELDPESGPVVAIAIVPPAWGRPGVVQLTPVAVVAPDAGGVPRTLPLEGAMGLHAAATTGAYVYLAGASALLRFDGQEFTPIPLPGGFSVGGLAATVGGVVAFGPQGVAWLSDGGTTIDLWSEDATGAAAWSENTLVLARGSSVSAFAFDPVTTSLSAVGLWHADLDLGGESVRALVAGVSVPSPLDAVVLTDTRVMGVRGGAEVDVPLFAASAVPLQSNVAAARTPDGGLVVATPAGAYRIMDRGRGPEWRVYGAERWLPSEDVRAVAVAPGDASAAIYFATARGTSWVEARAQTLEQKLGPFVTRIVERHNREGAVADSRLTRRGDLSSNIPWDSDNDGGWTSYWLLGECYRWRVTGAADARAHFDEALEAMLRLHDLTGTDYFLARAVIRREGCALDDCDDPDDGEWFLSPDGAFWVKGDTSNDEYIAHVFMMGPAYDLCATDSQKVRIERHIRNIVGGVIDHGYQLVDLDGLPTTYGRLDPDYVNGDPGAIFGDGGTRSLEMISSLTFAHYLTGEQRFLDAKAELIEEHGYGDHLVAESTYPGRRGSGDGDELGVYGWITLLRYERDPVLRARWMEGWERTRAHLRLQQGAWWDVAHMLVGGAEESTEATLHWLRQAPVDMIRWSMRNSHRFDLMPAPGYYQFWGFVRTDGRIIPYDERATDRWNTNQFKRDGGFDGRVEMDGADVLAPYWIARYYQMIVPAPGD